jgi:hypothetical protein
MKGAAGVGAVALAVAGAGLAGGGAGLAAGASQSGVATTESVVSGVAPDAPDARTVVAVGDIASAEGLDDRVAAMVASQRPDRLLLLGDIAYPDGSDTDFARYFAPDWGRFSNLWLPVPGNHEYRTPAAAGYRRYFGLPAGALTSSRRVGAWRVIGLDSQLADSSSQLAWLRSELAAHDGTPTLVMWHHPRFSSGEHGDQRSTDRLWDAVKRDPDVRLVLWGHDHNYERMAIPVKGREPVTAMVVGTGGGELRPTPRMPDRSWREFYVDGVTGAVRLQLAADSFSWAFLTAEGQTLDAGSRALAPRPSATVSLRAVKGSSKLRVNVDPNKGRGNWRFQVQVLGSDGTWATKKREYRTKGAGETRTVNLRKGTYRVVVRPEYGYLGATSSPVTLVR